MVNPDKPKLLWPTIPQYIERKYMEFGEEMDALKRQIGGDHYKRLGRYQPWEIIDALGLDFYEGTILSYLLREKDNRIEDLKKLIHTTEHYIEVLERVEKEETDAGDTEQIQR